MRNRRVTIRKVAQNIITISYYILMPCLIFPNFGREATKFVPKLHRSVSRAEPRVNFKMIFTAYAYVIGHYNTSVRITIALFTPLMLFA